MHKGFIVLMSTENVPGIDTDKVLLLLSCIFVIDHISQTLHASTTQMPDRGSVVISGTSVCSLYSVESLETLSCQALAR